ncbi:uncharacterized protein BDZ99DRAFT_493217 [Mytilinidion resinicola]|uniref:Uncharacterized protein n=1 Tax=Mytilinidion resinicola TaxID=574789 RepID=A0A6A6Z9B0_9PEZI|nr:uncharacterized protein BDZ99DRAFT_493217 [Mytilinidion resinicola]KAF2817388.1 hypothetical protein BDZ99DRAFT_493217 [Mytilinidion resinicola]
MDPSTTNGGFAVQAPPPAINTTRPQAHKKPHSEKRRPIGKKPANTKFVSQEEIREHIQNFVAVWNKLSEDEKSALQKVFSYNPNTLSAKTHAFVYGTPKKSLADRITPSVKIAVQEAEKEARKLAKVEKRKTIRAQKNGAKAVAQHIQGNAQQVLATVQEPIIQEPKVQEANYGFNPENFKVETANNTATEAPDKSDIIDYED